MKQILAAILIFTFTSLPAAAGLEVSQYEIPDVKDRYCGVELDFHYCKCAFHNQYCNVINIDTDGAHAFVLQSFREWNSIRIKEMAQNCLARDGAWDKSKWTCTYCTGDEMLKNNRCEPVQGDETEKKECAAALKYLPNNWEKYSDFDERLGGDVSYEVQQFNSTLNQIADLTARAQEIEFKLEISRQYRQELRAYKQALVQDLKTNLLKAFWRLSYVTYATVKSGQGAKGSIEKILDPQHSIEAIGAGMKLVQGNIPGHEKELQFDTNTVSGKIKSTAWNATLETMESFADPSAIAQQLMKDVKGNAVPGANITDEEIAILKTQHLDNKAVDEALASSYTESALLRSELLDLEIEIKSKYNDLQNWKLKEYQRVRVNLEDQCSNN